MKIRRFALAPVAAALMLAAAAPAAPPEGAADRIRADVEFLASDLLEGRDTGSRGHDIAAAYVASQFRAIGLEPGTAGSWYQQVPFRRATAAGPAQASLVIGKDEVPLGADDFAARPSLTQQQRSVDAPLVFVGHGVSDLRLGIDDYAGVDVRGKIAVVLEGPRPGLPGDVAAHLQSQKQIIAASKGALGLVEIVGTQRPPGRVSHHSGPVVDWVDATGKGASHSARLKLVGGLSRALGDRLFKAAALDLEKMLSAARSGRTAPVALPARLRLTDRSGWEDFTSPNVVALLPGSDPMLRGEHVVLMAHLDHLGASKDGKAGEDRIRNGAIDNAAGVATMLETARAFAASGKPPRRSVLFIALTGEERGLRGADFFAANPTVAPESLVGAINVDMPMLLYHFTDLVAFGGDHSTIARTIATAAASMGVTVSPDPMPQEAIFVRSDHYRFVTRGVPAIMLMTGYANGGEAKWKQFFTTAYHRPNDDLSQPIRWDQGARFAELNYRIARELADSDARPLWYEGDYFGETFAPAQPKAAK